MDGFGTDSNVIVMAATNRLNLLDTALIRPGRFDRMVEVNLPDLEGRRQIFNVHLKKIVVDPTKTKD
jgi:ATP-dependent Zn protease